MNQVTLIAWCRPQRLISMLGIRRCSRGVTQKRTTLSYVAGLLSKHFKRNPILRECNHLNIRKHDDTERYQINDRMLNSIKIHNLRIWNIFFLRSDYWRICFLFLNILAGCLTYRDILCSQQKYPFMIFQTFFSSFSLTTLILLTCLSYFIILV